MKKKMLDKMTVKKTIGKVLESAGDTLIYMSVIGFMPKKYFKVHQKPNYRK